MTKVDTPKPRPHSIPIPIPLTFYSPTPPLPVPLILQGSILSLPLLQHDTIHARLHQCMHALDLPLKITQALRNLNRDGTRRQILQGCVEL
jgi:hypothetical protein